MSITLIISNNSYLLADTQFSVLEDLSLKLHLIEFVCHSPLFYREEWFLSLFGGGWGCQKCSM